MRMKKITAFVLSISLLLGNTTTLIASELHEDTQFDGAITDVDIQVEKIPEDDLFEYESDILAEDNVFEIEDVEIDFDNLSENEDANQSRGDKIDAEITIAPRAAGIDVYASSLKLASGQSTSLKALTNYKFTVALGNNGSTSASNVILRVTHNGASIGDINLGTIPANSSGTVNFEYAGLKHGSNTLGATLDPNKVLADTNRNNNSTSASFTTTGTIDLQATSLTAQSGRTTTQSVNFDFSVTNIGTRNAPASTMRITIGGQPNNLSLPAINVGYRVSGSFSVTFNVSGTHTVLMNIDPQNLISESNKTNNSRSVNVTIAQNTDLWAGKWPNATNLTVYITSGAQDLFTKSVLSSYTVWNGRNSKVNFGSPTYSTNDNSSLDKIDVFVTALSGDTLATCQVENSGGALTDHFNDSQPYIKARIYLDSRTDTNSRLSNRDAELQRKTIRHEFGHAIGLAHPTCLDPALMHQGTSNSYNRTTIAAHDEHNMNAKYK